jgi:hypothetical protein
MINIKNKHRLSLLILISSVFFIVPSQAAFSPYNKNVNLNFDGSIPWEFKNNEAVKFGKNKYRGKINYYHVKINNQRILLRLGQNDPSGDKGNTRSLDTLDIVDVLVDGQRLPIFQWCMNNRTTQADNKDFRPGTITKKNVCINSGRGDFVIKLDASSQRLLSQRKELQFRIRPHKTIENLSYDLHGLPAIIERMVQAAKPVVAVKKVPVKKVVVKRPKARVKPKVKKPARICHIKPPVQYKSRVKSANYTCNSPSGKATAEKRVFDQLKIEKQKDVIAKNAAAFEQKREEEAQKKADSEMSHFSNKLKSMEDSLSVSQSLWLNRCKKHWNSGTNPCYCQQFISQAPPGTVNSCKK